MMVINVDCSTHIALRQTAFDARHIVASFIFLEHQATLWTFASHCFGHFFLAAILWTLPINNKPKPDRTQLTMALKYCHRRLCLFLSKKMQQRTENIHHILLEWLRSVMVKRQRSSWPFGGLCDIVRGGNVEEKKRWQRFGYGKHA